jgi:hypothetical protein
MKKLDKVLDKINKNENKWVFKVVGDNIACFDENGGLVSMVYIIDKYLLSISYFPPRECEFVGEYHFYFEDILDKPKKLISFIEDVIAQYRASLYEE